MKWIPVILVPIFLFGCTPKNKDEQQLDRSSLVMNEKYRPQFHFTPDSMWMNDPNGMVFYDGEYHLFYQYYPDSTVWGPMHWGHAISTDLVHWEHQPVALYPDEHGYIFSGSAVVDWSNTSGLGKNDEPPLIAIFTYHDPVGKKVGDIDYQTQGIAYSNDKGRTWNKYEGNPVLENPGIRDFRDPKVTWHENIQKWIMTLAVKDHIEFYSSPNLIDWQKESEFGKNLGAHGGVWECPDLFEMQVAGSDEKEWVLLVSLNPGGPNGGSATQYFVGDFDGSKFMTEQTETKWLDYGRDNYAGVTWSDIPEEDGRKLFIGWMSNWSYANVVPTKKWRSAMTFPRELKLIKKDTDYVVASYPVKEIEKIRTEKRKLEAQSIENNFEINHGFFAPSTSLEMKLIIDSEQSTANNFGVEFKNEDGEFIRIGYNNKEECFYIDRTNSGQSDFSKEFSGLHKMPFKLKDGKLDITLLYDAASIELFAYNGEVVMTDIFFANKPFNHVVLYAKDGRLNLKDATIYKLKSIWK